MLIVTLASSVTAAPAAASECLLPVLGVSIARSEAPLVAREADRRLGWVLQSIEGLGDELRHADFSGSPRSGRERRDIVGAVVRMSVMPWLDMKRAACACAEPGRTPPTCTRLEADAGRLRLALPRSSVRRPIDVDRLTKGR